MKFYTACGIEDTCARGLLGVAGKMPAKQSALQNNLKSEANHRLGYFFAQNRAVNAMKNYRLANKYDISRKKIALFAEKIYKIIWFIL